MTLALLLTAATGAWAQEETLLTTITPTGKGSYSETTAGVVTVTPSNVRRYDSTYGWLWGGSGSVTVEAKEGYTITKCVFKQNAKTPVTITTSPFAITFDEEWGRCVQNDDMDGVTSIEVYGYANAPAEPAIDVTTNKAEGETTFTEASFLMQTSDVTVNYELVRDMSVKMSATMGDGTDGLRYRVKKEDNVFKPADLSPAQVMALFSVNDQIEQKVLTPTTDYIVNIYAIDEEGQPTGNPMTFADFTFEPGIYAVKAVAAEGSPYDGESALSNIFELFQGYELEIAAGEFATYYKDEALYVEDKDAKLYTITTVGNETATATELTVAAANTPLLVKNNAAEAKTILLIPTTTATPNDVTPNEGFKGTLEATQIAASTATQNNYALNGKEFVWVMDAIDIAANRAWLEIPATTTNSRALTIVFDDVTGMSNNLTPALSQGEGAWYDLNGRKLQAAPTKKGVYIMNGKKVVVK